MNPQSDIIDSDDDRIHVEFTETIAGDETTITGWPEAAEDLDLLGPGPKEAHGVEVVDEEERYYDEEAQERVAGYTRVVLAFDDAEAMESASDRLSEKATERFEWGIADSAEDVQDFGIAIPSKRSVEA